MQHAIPERREFKYLLPGELIDPIRQALAGICTLDAHAGPDRRYAIRSLYLDTADLRLYTANDLEAPVRFKARVRCYPGAGKRGPVFFEIKHRTLDIIRKTRFKVKADRLSQYLTDFPAPSDDDPRWARFCSLQWTYGLRPWVQVEYQREAYMSRLEDYARVSIDTDIRCQRASAWSLSAGPRQWRGVDHTVQTATHQPVAVLELKFAGQAPWWMFDLVRRFDLIRHSYSKYCYSIAALLTSPRSSVSAGL